MNQNPSPEYRYAYHQTQNIHEFVVHTASNFVVDQYVSFMEQIFQKARQMELPAGPIRVLLDISQSGIFPLRYFYHRAGAVIRAYPDAPPGRIAYLSEKEFEEVIADSFDVIIRPPKGEQRNVRAFFKPDARDEAIAWLLQE